MKISSKTSRIVLVFIIVLSLAISTLFMVNKQGFHEDELLTYNLANHQNSSQQTANGILPRILMSICP